VHPKTVKLDLAQRIVRDFHGAASAAQAGQAFEARFARGEMDESALPVVDVQVPAGGSVALSRVLVDAGLASSTSEAARKIQQGGVKLGRHRVTLVTTRVDASRPELVLEVGRRAVRLRVRPEP
jgi:tyrosyl-tRNA synthetase